MNNKLNNVLLIDDDKTTNILNEMVIKKYGFTDNVTAVQNGIEALKYLKSGEEGNHPRPDLIFLDINMPGMDGWEFMEEYHKLDPKYQGNIVLVMLTTSLNPNDQKKALAHKGMDGFMNKPLTKEQLSRVLDKNFPELAKELTVLK